MNRRHPRWLVRRPALTWVAPALGLALLGTDAEAQRSQMGNGRPRSIATAPGAPDAIFSASNGLDGAELWRWDGTVATQLADINPGPASSYPIRTTRFLANGVDTLFVANDGVSGRELWSWDGGSTVAQVADIETAPGKGADPASLTVFPTVGGTMLLFNARDTTSGRELWCSDGLTATLLADLEPGPASSFPSKFTVLGGVAIFSAFTSGTGAEPWVTDGTPGGTVPLMDIWPGVEGSAPRDFAVFGGFVYFAATEPTAGREIWRTDGTPGGTTRVTDLAPGTDHANPELLTAGPSALAFTADDGVNDRQVWLMTDPGQVTTRMSAFPGDLGASIREIVPVGLTEFYFDADDGITGLEMWRTTALGVAQVADINSTGSSRPRNLQPVPGGVIARAFGTGIGEELHFVSPTLTFPIDIRSGPHSSNPSRLVPYGSFQFLFAAEDGTTGIELWQTSGSIAQRLTDLDPDLPLPETVLSFDSSSLTLEVIDGGPNNLLIVFLGLGSTSPIPFFGAAGALLLDPLLPLTSVTTVIGASGVFTAVIPGPPETGIPLGIQSVTVDATVVPRFSNITIWSTGQGGTDSAATLVKVKGKFDDDTGEYIIKAERTDPTTEDAYVALIVVDDAGHKRILESFHIKSGETRFLEDSIEDLLSPISPFDPPATSLEVRVYSKPPSDDKLGGGTVVWESYC